MKNPIRSLFLVAICAFATSAFAAVDCYLKIEGKGVSRTEHCPNGTCTISNLAPGDYTVTACTSEGRPMAPENAAALEIKSPRDVATGQASGKRTHKPITITKEWSSSAPVLKVTVPEQDCPVILNCTAKAGYNVKENKKA